MASETQYNGSGCIHAIHDPDGPDPFFWRCMGDVIHEGQHRGEADSVLWDSGCVGDIVLDSEEKEQAYERLVNRWTREMVEL